MDRKENKTVFCSVKQINLDINKLPPARLMSRMKALGRRTKKCLDWRLVDNKLGEGIFGNVYGACCGNDCKYVAKIQTNTRLSRKETKLMNICGEKNLCLPPIDSFWDKNLKCGVIIFRALNYAASDIIKNSTL